MDVPEPWRTFILFLTGLAGVAYETLFVRPADPTLVVLFAAMMGIPFFLSRNGKGGNGR